MQTSLCCPTNCGIELSKHSVQAPEELTQLRVRDHQRGADVHERRPEEPEEPMLPHGALDDEGLAGQRLPQEVQRPAILPHKVQATEGAYHAALQHGRVALDETAHLLEHG